MARKPMSLADQLRPAFEGIGGVDVEAPEGDIEIEIPEDEGEMVDGRWTGFRRGIFGLRRNGLRSLRGLRRGRRCRLRINDGGLALPAYGLPWDRFGRGCLS